ncbi:hypothetical protein BC831DRAFT_510233 [Entophlyctis helioformis]|nr:hypothetical protein BC831DRAFT_510233 [Entophlyctis helioformis]
MASTSGVAPLETFDYVTLVFMSIAIAFNISLVARLQRIPHSLYIAGLRTNTYCVIPCLAVMLLAWFVFPVGATHDTLIVVALALLVIIIQAFAFAQLEFLKILSPFVEGINPYYVVVAQVVSMVVATVVMAATLSLLGNITYMRIIGFTIFGWESIVGLYDTCLQLFMLHFVFRRLKDATAEFRARYAALICFNAILILLNATHFLAVTSFDVNSWAFRGTITISYGIVAIELVEILRGALHNTTQKRSTPIQAQPSVIDRRLINQTTTSATGGTDGVDAPLASVMFF